MSFRTICCSPFCLGCRHEENCDDSRCTVFNCPKWTVGVANRKPRSRKVRSAPTPEVRFRPAPVDSEPKPRGRPSLVSFEDLSKMIQRYEAGESLQKVGERFGLSLHTVRNHLARAGVKIRPRGKGFRGWLAAQEAEGV